jgi:hypothetical protein
MELLLVGEEVRRKDTADGGWAKKREGATSAAWSRVALD